MPRHCPSTKILELGADVTIRSARDCTARDLNKKLMDAIFPLSEWRTLHTLAWLQSRGKSLAFQDKWLLLFEVGEGSCVALVERNFLKLTNH